MRILYSELSQIKGIAIIWSLAIVFVKVALIAVISWNLTPLPIFLSDSKIDKKEYPFFKRKSSLKTGVFAAH